MRSHFEINLKNVLIIALVIIFKTAWPLILMPFLLRKRKEYLALGLMLGLIFLRIMLSFVPFNYYYVFQINNNGVKATNLLKEVRIYDECLKIGDLIKLDDVSYEEGNFKGDEYEIVYHFSNTSNLLYEHLDNLKSFKFKSLLKALVLNIYPDDSLLGFDYELGLSKYLVIDFFYKVLKRLKDKEYMLIIACVPFGLLEGFSYTLIRVFVILFFKGRFLRSDALAYSALIMIFFDPFKVNSLSFIFPFLLRFLLLIFKSSNFQAILAILQSFFFGAFSPINLIFFKYIVFISYVLGFLGLLLSFFENPRIVEVYVNALAFLNEILSYEIRGQITLIGLIIFAILNHYLSFGAYIKLGLVSMILVSGINAPFLSISFLDVGQGDAILIQTPFQKENILIDTGSPYNANRLLKNLKEKGVYKIDHLIITHLDLDHVGNVKSLSQEFMIDQIHFDHEDISTKELTLYSLNSHSFDNRNDNSLVYYLNIEGFSYLFCADISAKVESKILRSYDLNADVLKLGHHGSNTSSSEYLLSHLNPLVAIASTSGAYNHPSIEVLQRLKRYDIKSYITKDDGTISFYHSFLPWIFIQSRHSFDIIVK